MMLAVGFLVDAVCEVEEVRSVTFSESFYFYHEWILKFMKYLFCTDGYDHVIFNLNPVNMVGYYID